MKNKIRHISTLIMLLLFIICQVVIAQQDNGNHFEMSWSTDFDVFHGHGKGFAALGGFDLDKDGYKEFMVFDKYISFTSYDAIILFEASGDNEFNPVWQQNYQQEQGDDEGHGIAIADLDEDGNEEVLVAAEDAIYIYEWDGETFESGGGLPQEPTTVFYPIFDPSGRAMIRQLRVVNVDDDPEKELVMGYWNRMGGIYMAIASLPNKDLVNPDWKDEFADDFSPWFMGGICIDDFDGDGRMEIFTSHSHDGPATRLYESNGPDSYEIKFTNLPENLPLNPMFIGAFANPVFHDFNGDNIKELVIGDVQGNVWIITDETSNNFQDFGADAWKFLLHMPDVQETGYVRSGFLADLDRDGKSDVYYNAYTSQSVLDLEYQNGPVTEGSSWATYHIYKGHKLVYGYIYPVDDLDGDGKGEVIISGNGDAVANLQIIENQDVASLVNERAEVLPDQFSLHQNYPNPFNPETTINYSLSQSEKVTLTIYNLQGKEVATLIAGELQSGGHYSMNWNGLDMNGKLLSSGLYFCRLQADDFVDTKKMTLMK
jgi:hypothetical protein